jgi:hypothetical protein
VETGLEPTAEQAALLPEMGVSGGRQQVNQRRVPLDGRQEARLEAALIPTVRDPDPAKEVRVHREDHILVCGADPSFEPRRFGAGSFLLCSPPKHALQD